MAISEVPPHTIAPRLLAEVERIRESLNEGVAGGSGSSAQRFALIAETFGEFFSAQASAVNALETEILKLRVLLDLHGILDFDAKDPSAT